MFVYDKPFFLNKKNHTLHCWRFISCYWIFDQILRKIANLVVKRMHRKQRDKFKPFRPCCGIRVVEEIYPGTKTEKKKKNR